MTDAEWDAKVESVRGRLATIELAIMALKRDVAQLEEVKPRWNPCQQDLREKDMGWP